MSIRCNDGQIAGQGAPEKIRSPPRMNRDPAPRRLKDEEKTNETKHYRSDPRHASCAVHWFLRYFLSLRDVEKLLVDRGLKADHTTSGAACRAMRPKVCGPSEAEKSLMGCSDIVVASRHRSADPVSLLDQPRLTKGGQSVGDSFSAVVLFI
jgi:hypothetical protein